jgi:hypothetical protein
MVMGGEGGLELFTAEELEGIDNIGNKNSSK